MIVYSFPLLILLFTPFVEKRAIPLMYVGLFALAFLGLALVVSPSFEGLKWQGLVAAVGAACLTAIQFFVLKRAAARVSPLALVFYGHCVALPIVLTASLFLGGISSLAKVSQSLWLVAIVCGGYILGYFMQLVASKRLSPALSGLIFCFEPVVALITAWLVLGESLSTVQQLGAALVIAILLLTSLLDYRKPQL
jgi:drug/metabolite transporter (DMT)-like permease